MTILKIKFFRSLHLIYLIFSFKTKMIHPILLYPQVSFQMIKMKINIRFIINELPVKDILFKKDLEADNNCDLCHSGLIQTVEHVLSQCAYFNNDAFIKRKWNDILKFTKNQFLSSDYALDSYFLNPLMKSQFLTNPFSFNNKKYSYSVKNSSSFVILDHTQEYLEYVYKTLKKFLKARKHANIARQ